VKGLRRSGEENPLEVQPALLRGPVEELARDRGEAVDDVAAATTAAANAFFRLPV